MQSEFHGENVVNLCSLVTLFRRHPHPERLFTPFINLREMDPRLAVNYNHTEDCGVTIHLHHFVEVIYCMSDMFRNLKM